MNNSTASLADAHKLEDQSLIGKIAFVTGGAQGLGAAIVRQLASHGARVVIGDVRLDTAEALVQELRDEGNQVQAMAVDLRDDVASVEALDRTVAELGRLDILINNAGTDRTVSIEELTVAEWDQIMAVNLRAPFVLSRRAFEHMKVHGGGSIVNITSTAAKRAWSNASAYHASKWGLLGLSHAMHVEGRALGIKVTALVSGGMRTPFLLDRFPDLDPEVLQDPATVARAVVFALQQPPESVIPELMVLPMRESSWP
ncbi:MAG TPA: SDR family oxidoreductase [Chloroflexota bacterium]|jgi:NAD(P)-dependent dehydrogenase (short-subunit alcohol dehydrogenase family)|nr:SDR family oxidoreductase [Chloroflexota bacterium]